MMPTALLRVDGGHRLGLGHVKRCLTLAGELMRRGVKCTFVCREPDAVVNQLVKSRGYSLEVIGEEQGLVQEGEALVTESRFAGDMLVLDISHGETMGQASIIPDWFSSIRQRYPVLIVIDGHLDHCLAGYFDLPADLVVVPYVGVMGERLRVQADHVAAGAEYFILDPAYLNFAGKRGDVADVARRLLITAGGSDLAGLSAKALGALERISLPMDVRVVIGPAFNDRTRRATVVAAQTSRHTVEVIDAPSDLAGHMAWCDLAISATGLTKYELAATGTPSILLSIDAKQETFDQAFRETAVAIHLGIVGDVTIEALAASVTQLSVDQSERTRLSTAGQALLDGCGAIRVADAILAAHQLAAGRARLLPASEIQ